MFQMHQLPGVPWQGQVRRSESPNAEGKCRSTYQRLPAILSMQSIPKKRGVEVHPTRTGSIDGPPPALATSWAMPAR